jgi:GTPase SAR1 family protein
MRPHLLYIIGVPGSGKSTLVAELVRGKRRRVYKEPFAHTDYIDDGFIQLGREREGHSGTDALSMSVQPKVIAALEAQVWPRVLGEGDRLANKAFFDAARAAGYHVDVVLLDTPEPVAAQRRAARGTNQDPTWLKGRISKVEHLVEEVTIWLDGTKPVDQIAALLMSTATAAAVLKPQEVTTC